VITLIFDLIAGYPVRQSILNFVSKKREDYCRLSNQVRPQHI